MHKRNSNLIYILTISYQTRFRELEICFHSIFDNPEQFLSVNSKYVTLSMNYILSNDKETIPNTFARVKYVTSTMNVV